MIWAFSQSIYLSLRDSMKNFIIIVIWFVVFMAILTLSLRLISMPDTLTNLLGVVLLTGSVIVSAQCVKFINDKRKHEK